MLRADLFDLGREYGNMQGRARGYDEEDAFLTWILSPFCYTVFRENICILQRGGSKPMRLLVVEDEPDLALALEKGLRKLGYAVDLAFDGEQGWMLAEVNDYDLMVLDLNLPGMDGLEVCRRLRKTRPALLVLMLTARATPDERVTGLQWGADDYLVKPFYFAELLARIAALLRRDLRTRALQMRYEDLTLDPAAHVAWRGSRRLSLTSKEFHLLEYLLRHPGEVVSQETLLEHVWDAQANPLSNTVRVHINSLRRKLGDETGTAGMIETVVGQGYRLGRLSE